MKNIIVSIVLMLCIPAFGQEKDTLKVDTMAEKELSAVTVSVRKLGVRRMGGAENGVIIGREELFKAACCNLGESFTTTPSVDVKYSDATTGARQIKLLGLSGTYVQMLTENLPNFRGAAAPYALDYVPGPWMSGIQVSKGASSVKNGYESITGQIDVEYLKPDAEQGATLNLYGNSKSKMEANADANIHLGQKLSTEVLAHYQNDFGHHDSNDDGFLDQPNVRQWNLQNRWHGRSDRYIFHGGLGMIKEKREGGQVSEELRMKSEESPAAMPPLYKIGLVTDHYEGYMKHAFILNPEHGSNIAILANFSLHQLDANYGNKHYDVNQKNAYAQLLFETNFTEHHNLSAGLSLNHDYYNEELRVKSAEVFNDKETTSGAYAQYTYNLHNKVVAMAGMRVDHSSLDGTFVTPRFHLKYVPSQEVSLRISAGKGYRTVHALAENNYLLASGRNLVIDNLNQEEAWNYGISSSFYIPLFGKTLKLNAEYYHTRFSQQAVIDYDSNPAEIRITNLDGKSYSNTIQVDASYPVIKGLELTAAWRWNDVKCSYAGQLMEKPLTSRFKGLLTASYKTPLGLWQFDATLQLNGGGRMPKPVDGLWQERFPAYEQLSAQITRWFRHFSVYVGGENLTSFRQEQTIINATAPWSERFDPTMVWGPVHGAMFYAGIRVNIGRN
ncbi:MAG: TonB-dependent receptor [Bacteroidaceae bacterium]|nr:TonB-dependent receptor [Bacteroidaceae bacterium]